MVQKSGGKSNNIQKSTILKIEDNEFEVKHIKTDDLFPGQLNAKIVNTALKNPLEISNQFELSLLREKYKVNTLVIQTKCPSTKIYKALSKLRQKFPISLNPKIGHGVDNA